MKTIILSFIVELAGGDGEKKDAGGGGGGNEEEDPEVNSSSFVFSMLFVKILFLSSASFSKKKSA